MNFFDVLNMIGGLALFLYGMHVLGEGLTKVSGGRMERILEKLTDSPIKGVLLGTAVTAVGEDTRLPACERTRLRAQTFKHYCHQRRRLLLAGGHQCIHFPRRWVRGYLPGKVDERVSRVAHRGYHNHKVLLPMCALKTDFRRAPQSFNTGEGASAEFLHNQHVRFPSWAHRIKQRPKHYIQSAVLRCIRV